MKKTPVGEIDNFPFTINRITIPVKVLVMDALQYQALIGNNWLQKANANLNWETQELTISYQEQHAQIPATCGTFNKCSEKAPAFEFELEEEKPIIKTFMALGSTSNWADETEQQYFSTNDSLETKEPVTSRWNKLSSMRACISPEEEYGNYIFKRSEKWDETPCLTCGEQLPDECNWINVAFRGGVCDQTCQYALLISEKVTKGTPFNAAYNSALNKLYYYPYDAKMIFNLAIALINGATQENVRQMKESEYIAYTFEIAGYNYENEVKCPECYALSIPLPSENDENEIEFGEPEATEEIEATPIYLIENQPALQLKYFNNNRQGIKSKKAYEIDAGYDLRYPNKDTFVLKPKSLTKINLKIALKILPGAMIQIVSQSSLASKGINVRGEIIDAGYIGNITIILQNETDKSFKIEHAKKIAQVIYLLLINISGLQLVNQREQLGKSERGTQGFVPVNIALNEQKEFHQLLQLLQPITIPPFEEHHKVYTCENSMTTQQIFKSNEQICLKHNISIPNIYVPRGAKKVQVTFYNLNHQPIILLNKLEIRVIHSNIFHPRPSSKIYHVVMEKLSRINMRQLEPYQQKQLKELIAEFADIFTENNNNLGRTDLVQHQIYTGNAKLRRQQAY
ncbi:hypothetical protein G9A89_006882 [Geosiphon pyriformis]|nr:hypothetical protein G9A89_006882 [Geosiphon pyriformis]